MIARVFLAIPVILAACGGGGDAADDPNRPAVVQAPPVILPSDTAKPDTMPAYRERMALAAQEFQREYALSAAAAVLADRRMIVSIYADSATLRLGDATYAGSGRVADALVDFVRRSSIQELIRMPGRVEYRDSTYIDSGAYVFLAQRPGAAASQHRGTYVTTWRKVPGPLGWAIIRDEIHPSVPMKSR